MMFFASVRTYEAKADTPEEKPLDMPKKAELWFPVGECLTYRIRWGPFIVGYVKVFSEWIREDGRDLVAVRITIKSSRVLSTIYPVDDLIESIVDTETFLPLRFTRRLSEGHYRLHEVTTFDHKAGVAHWQHLLKDKSEDFAIESDTRDFLSFMFFMRSHKFEPEKKYHFRVMADEKLYDLDVITKNYKKVKVPNFGRIRSLLVVPSPKFQGVIVSIGRINIWISDDKRCLGTRVTARVPVGSIRAILIKVEGPGDDSWSCAGDEKEQTGEDDEDRKE